MTSLYQADRLEASPASYFVRAANASPVNQRRGTPALQRQAWAYRESLATEGPMIDTHFVGRSPGSSPSILDPTDDYLIATALHDELKRAKRMVDVMRASPAPAWRAYVANVGLVLDAVIEAPPVGLRPLLNLVTLLRSTLLATLEPYPVWLSAVTAAYPEWEEVPIPERFVIREESARETEPAFGDLGFLRSIGAGSGA